MVEQMQVQENIESIKNSVVNDKQKIDVEEFVKKLDEAKTEGNNDETYALPSYEDLVKQAFEKQGENVLNNIKGNVTTKLEENTVKWNDENDNTVKTFNSALNAFETDIRTYCKAKKNKKEKVETGEVGTNVELQDNENNLEYEFNLVQSIKKLITDKQIAVKKEESNKLEADAMLNTIPTSELAKNLFDNSNPEIYNLIMERIYGTAITTIEISAGSEDDQGKLYQWMTAYVGGSEKMKSITNIKLGKPSDGFGKRYAGIDGIKRIIEYKQTGKTNTQYIIHGSYEHLQEELAKTNENTELAPDKIIALDKKTRAERLNDFDDIGNYALFNKYLEKKGPEYVNANLTGILQAINIYTPGAETIDKEDGRINKLKNGYANTFTDYVIIHSDILLESYANQLTEKNMNVFGVDQSTRIANFNKIVNKLNETGIRTKLPKTKQEELIKIKSKIEDKEAPGSATEALSKGLDNMIDTFGPMLFNILKFFGIGKATMMKRFPTMTEKINSMFQKEYALSSDEIGVINTIIEKHGKEVSRLDTAKKIKDAFAGEKDDYISHFLDAKTGYYKYLNINIIKTGLKAYNKKNNKNITIDNIVTIEKNKNTGKEYIASITDQDVFKASLGNIFDTDDIWSEIHNANIEIQRKNKDDATINEHNMKEKDAERYLIQNNQDIARYLTASLFSTKDLAYVMTENSLHNGSEIQNNTPEPNPSEILTFNETYVNIDGKVINDSKMIHEVIKDIDKAPEKLIIVRNGKKIPVTKKTNYKETGTKITTYVQKDGTRVKIFKDDIIKKVENNNTVTKTPEELALEAFTNNRNKISGDDGIKKTVKKKYDTKLNISSIEKIETTATGELKNYQENILSPLKEIMTNEKQYKLLTDKFVSGNNKTDYEALFTNPLHIANILSIMNTEGNTPEISNDAINNLRVEGTFTVEADGKGLITITSQDKGTVTIKQKETNGKITLDALRAPKAAQV